MSVGTYRPRLILGSFDSMSESRRAGVLAHVVEGLIAADMAWLEEHPETPALFDSGVHYKARGLNDCGDDWRDIPAILAHRGEAVCEDIAAWRIAELRLREGVYAVPVVTSINMPELLLYHVRVGFPDGTVEDTSVLLGMPL